MLKRLYGAFAKVTKNDDGTLTVEGIASSEAVDSDGEIIKADAMRAALPDYMKFAAVREMHGSIAAGTALKCFVNDEGLTIIEAHVVDAGSVKKVETKVLKGFSIGGKVTGRDELNKSTITGIQLVEISLVDRPANPDAIITCFKADGIDDPEIVAELADRAVIEARTVASATKAMLDENAKKAAAEVAAVDQLAEHLNKGAVSATTLLALIKAHQEKNGTIKKGLYGVSCFAEVLCTLGYLASDAQSEADWEGDSSPVPAGMRDWVQAGAKLFQDMATEESNELIASLRASAGEVDLVEMAARAGVDLKKHMIKAGAKFSVATKETLTSVHKAVSDAHDALAMHVTALKDADKDMTELGYHDMGDEDSEQSTEDGQKAAAAKAEAEKAAALAAASPGAAPTEFAGMPGDIGALILHGITTTKAATPAAVVETVPAEKPRPVLFAVDKSGVAAPITGAAAAATGKLSNEEMIKTAIRGAYGLPA